MKSATRPQMICVPLRANDSDIQIISVVRNCVHCGEKVIVDALNAAKNDATREMDICCIYCVHDHLQMRKALQKPERTAENLAYIGGRKFEHVPLPNAMVEEIINNIVRKHPRPKK